VWVWVKEWDLVLEMELVLETDSERVMVVGWEMARG
jgi:hypothetical protein